MSMNICIKKIREDAVIPTRGTQYSAGCDLYASIERQSATIPAGETVMIGTGIAFAIPDGYVGLVYARSGLASKRGLRPANCVGVIDSDYRGEVMVALHNDGIEAQTIHERDRIAQIIIMPYPAVDYVEVYELDDTERGDGGFGSTDKG